jgi:hypothetical protein
MKISIAKRVILPGTRDFQVWSEGNVTYASMRAKYKFSFLNPKDPLYSKYTPDIQTLENSDHFPTFDLVLIVEKNPVSGGWILSSYRGIRSGYTRGDVRSFRKFFRSQLNQFSKYYQDGVSRITRQTIENIDKARFRNYYKYNDILYIKIRNEETLVYLKPINFNSYKHTDSAIRGRLDGFFSKYCPNLVVGQYKSWKLPKQPKMARLLKGSAFSEWKRYRIKDLPDGHYWGDLIDRMIKTNYSRIISSDEADDKSGIYIVVVDDRTQTFWGELHLYRQISTFNVSIVCINSNKGEVAAFKQKHDLE